MAARLLTPAVSLATVAKLRFHRIAGVLIAWADDQHRTALALGHPAAPDLRRALLAFVAATDPAAPAPSAELCRVWVGRPGSEPAPVTLCRPVADIGPDGSVLTVRGSLAAVRRYTTRQGRPWCRARLSTATGMVRLIVPPIAYDPAGYRSGRSVTVTGRVDRRQPGPPRLQVLDLAP